MKHIRCGKAAVLMMGIAGFGLAQAQETPIGAPQDWSSRSVIQHRPMTPDELNAASRGAEIDSLYRDPRYVASVLRRLENETPRISALAKSTGSALQAARANNRKPGKGDNKPGNSSAQLRDWSNVLGGGADGQGGNGVQGMFPAKYNFDIFAPPSCNDDYVVYPTNAAGASQSGTAQEQWSANFSGNPSNGQNITIGLAGRRQVQLTASSSNTGRNFQIGANASATADNLRQAINRWAGETGFRAEGSGATVTIISNTAGDINDASIAENMTVYNPTRTYSGSATPGQPTIIAFNQLYNTTCNAGRTNTNAPNVLWAYNTGNGYITETSPALSYLDNGKQVAFVQRNGNTLQLVLLKPGSGSGTAANPSAPASVSNAAYRGCNNAGGCYTTITFNSAAGANNNSAGGATWSAPFVDYATDTLWAGDGNGILHKFTGVFQGNPQEVTSGGFPRVVELGMKLSSPVYAGGSVYVGSQSGSGTTGGKLHRVNATSGALFSSTKLAVADSTGIREAVIVDNFTGSVFAFLFNDGTTGDGTGCVPTNPGVGNFNACRVVARFATGFGDGAAPLQRAYVGRGNSRVSTLYAGGFDDDYYNSDDASGAMYIVGGRPDDTYYPTLWKIPLDAGEMQTPEQGPQVGSKSCTTNQPDCSNAVYDWSPVTVIKNPHTELEYLFFSMPKDGNAITLILAEQGGMLMHASSVARDGRAFVFTGVSGAGKTTISRLCPADAHILTDEMSFIRPQEHGYFAHGTPFSGELGRPGENLSAPLAGVFLLAKGPENCIDALSPTEAVRALMANILYFARDDALTARVFDNAIALAARVPVRRLTFFPDARVWDFIGNHA